MDIKSACVPVNHRQINVNGASIHVAEMGQQSNQTILFLHGYPENWKAFEAVMAHLKDDYHLLAIDLSGIGKSNPVKSSDKYAIAEFINDFTESLNLKQMILAGHDIGGMITYAFLKHFPKTCRKQ